jgi:anaerobic C4-dicarboxylate transporter
MLTKVLMSLSASIILALGVLHLVYTFWGPKLTPRDPELQVRMEQVTPVITNETTMWRCWIGFNATHSMSLILFGVIYLFLAVRHSEFLFGSVFLLGVGLAMLGGLLVLAKAYFFSIPFAGVAVSLICYVASIVVAKVS